MSKLRAPGPDRATSPGPGRHDALVTRLHPGNRRAAGADPTDEDGPDAVARPPLSSELGPIVRTALAGRKRYGVEPEDACQEAWLKLLVGLAAGRVCEQSPAALVVMIRRHLADLGRRAARRRSAVLSPELVETLTSREDDPAEVCERGQAREVVRAVLAEARSRISDLGHQVVVLRWVDGLAFEEIAEILEMPVARVRDRHRRALLVIRSLLSRKLDYDRAELAGAMPGVGSEALAACEVTR